MNAFKAKALEIYSEKINLCKTENLSVGLLIQLYNLYKLSPDKTVKTLLNLLQIPEENLSVFRSYISDVKKQIRNKRGTKLRNFLESTAQLQKINKISITDQSKKG